MKDNANPTVRITRGEKTIDCDIIKSKKRKTAEISIDQQGKVIIRVPQRMSLARAQELVQHKADWIIKHLEQRAALAPPLERRFVHGEQFLYLGRTLTLDVGDHTARSTACELQNDHLVIRVKHSMQEQAQIAEEVRKSLERWYREEAELLLSERSELYAVKFGFLYNSVTVRTQRKRWGSCDSRGNIRYNWKLIMAPVYLIDYVIVHELCHLREMNHSKRFWQLVEKILPDYQERRKQLKLQGMRFTCDYL